MTVPLPWGGRNRSILGLCLGTLLFSISAVCGGFVLGFVVWMLGGWVNDAVLLTGGLMSSAAALFNMATGRMVFRPPSSGWQVPREWMRKGLWFYSGWFGFFVGLGVVTRAYSWFLYVLLFATASIGDLQFSVAVFVTYGLFRALPMAGLGSRAEVQRHQVDQHALRRLVRRINEFAGERELKRAEALATVVVVGSWISQGF